MPWSTPPTDSSPSPVRPSNARKTELATSQSENLAGQLILNYSPIESAASATSPADAEQCATVVDKILAYDRSPDPDALENGSKTPVVFSLNCLTGSFQRPEGDSFCEAFLKHPNGGAVGAIGATRTIFSGYNDLITHGIFASFWPAYDPTHANAAYPHSRRPAQALNYGKYYMMTYTGINPYTASGDLEILELRETGPDTGVFAASILTSLTAVVPIDGLPKHGAKRKRKLARAAHS